MPLSKKSCLVALTLLFWIAQIQGTMHGISHLGGDSRLHDRPVPHALVCSDCAAHAQAGAAPLPTHAEAALLVLADAAPANAPRALSASDPAYNYQSRAPPATSI
jgi:hypothetical protein